jgi:hypothetical protein
MAELVRFVLSHIVQDCPPELEACQDFREPHCTQAQWEGCKRRLATSPQSTTGESRP